MVILALYFVIVATAGINVFLRWLAEELEISANLDLVFLLLQMAIVATIPYVARETKVPYALLWALGGVAVTIASQVAFRKLGGK